MRINSNISSINSQHALGRTQGRLSLALERLSSGLRINRASDGAGGLAVSENMRGQIRGQQQAAKNVQDGLALTATADGGASEITGLIQRMRELAVQASNGTLSDTERALMQKEVTEMLANIDAIADGTKFNGNRVLRTSAFSAADFATVQNNLQNSLLGDAWQIVAGAYGLFIEGPIRNLNIYFDEEGVGGTLAYVSASGGPFYPSLELHVDMYDFLPGGGLGTSPFYNDRILAHELVHAMMFDQMNYPALPTWFAEGIAEFVHGADERVRGDLSALGGDNNANRQALLNQVSGGGWAGTSAAYSGAYLATRFLDAQLRANGFAAGMRDALLFLENNPGATMDQVAVMAGYANEAAFLTDVGNGTALAWVNANITAADLADADTGSILGNDYGGGVRDENTIVPNGTMTDTPWNEIYNPPTPVQITLQIGANEGEAITLVGVDASVSGLGLTGLDISTRAGALAAIDTLDDALEDLSSLRAQLGAQANSLESTLANVQASAENLSAAESRIRDTDVADEALKRAREAILVQTGTSVLAAANAKPRNVLALLQAATA